MLELHTLMEQSPELVRLLEARRRGQKSGRQASTSHRIQTSGVAAATGRCFGEVNCGLPLYGGSVSVATTPPLPASSLA